jgi:hypothetical protein
MEMPRTKTTDIDPLNLLRMQLIATRRAAAAAQDMTATVEAQSKLELIERAISDELRASH